MIYSCEDVRRLLDDLYKQFLMVCSDGEHCLYAEFLKALIKRMEKKL